MLGARVVIADCPSKTYLPSLLRATALHGSSKEARQSSEGTASSAVPDSRDNSSSSSSRDVFVIHLTDAKVADSPSFMCTSAAHKSYLRCSSLEALSTFVAACRLTLCSGLKHSVGRMRSIIEECTM